MVIPFFFFFRKLTCCTAFTDRLHTFGAKNNTDIPINRVQAGGEGETVLEERTEAAGAYKRWADALLLVMLLA